MGSTFSAEVSDTRELASVFLESFGREYEKLFVWYMIHHVRRLIDREEEFSKDGRVPEWKLYHAPYLPPQRSPRDTFIAGKLSKHLKRWNTRFFVLRGDYHVDYYDDRASFSQEKPPLGTLALGGLSVVRDVARGEAARAERLAALCGVPRAELPAPRPHGDATVGLFHARRRAVHLQFPAAERQRHWADALERAHWLGARLERGDRVHQRAFLEALARARRACGLPHSLECGGGELAILHDAVVELVDAQVMPKLLGKKSDMTWKERMALLSAFHKQSEDFLRGFVVGKWHVMQGHTIARRVIAEARVRDNMEAINAFVLPLVEEIHNYTRKDTHAFLAAQVELPLKELSAAVTPRLCAVFATLPVLYAACVSHGKVYYETQDDHMFLASQYNSIGECYDAERDLLELCEPIAAMKEKFNGRVYEWIVLDRSVLRLLRRMLTNSIFTFETIFERNKAHRSWDETQRDVQVLLEVDCRTVMRHAVAQLLYETAIHYFCDEHVLPSIEALKTPMITPLENRVPEELQPYIVSAQEILVDVLYADLYNMCDTIAESAVVGIE